MPAHKGLRHQQLSGERVRLGFFTRVNADASEMELEIAPSVHERAFVKAKMPQLVCDGEPFAGVWMESVYANNRCVRTAKKNARNIRVLIWCFVYSDSKL